jgi:hypothetical protein
MAGPPPLPQIPTSLVGTVHLQRKDRDLVLVQVLFKYQQDYETQNMALRYPPKI